jgi:hypothetical protein
MPRFSVQVNYSFRSFDTATVEVTARSVDDIDEDRIAKVLTLGGERFSEDEELSIDWWEVKD